MIYANIFFKIRISSHLIQFFKIVILESSDPAGSTGSDPRLKKRNISPGTFLPVQDSKSNTLTIQILPLPFRSHPFQKKLNKFGSFLKCEIAILIHLFLLFMDLHHTPYTINNIFDSYLTSQHLLLIFS